MKRALLSFSFFSLLVVLAHAEFRVTDLSCEYLRNPLGIDTRQPRLGWVLRALDNEITGQAQQAYQILVASDPSLLTDGEGDLWDTGWVESNQSQLIAYAGKPLRSNQPCWWKVRAKLSGGKTVAWSSPACWSMGILDAGEWKAKWIGTDLSFARNPTNAHPDPLLRKSFSLAAEPTEAFVHVASVGYHELYVNGQRAGDAVLAPCATDHTKRARYVTYDIAPLLRQGENVLGIWLGFSWSIFSQYKTADKPQSPIVLAQADITLADDQHVQVVTDSSWRWTGSGNSLIGHWDFMNFGGEKQDLAKEVKNWSNPGFDAGKWQAVQVFSPKLLLSAQNVEPNRLVGQIRPVAITEPKPGVWRVDMGVNVTGWFELNAQGEPGDTVTLLFSERPEQEMTHQMRCVLVLGPDGKGTFRNRFNYQVARWVQISGLRKKPALDDIRASLIRTDYSPAATFACSDDLLNRIYHATSWTYQNLSLGGYLVDCAQRERMGYGGDAHATTATGMDFFKTAALYSKWAEDWRDVQGKNPAEPGNLPYTAPTYWGGGGPGWSGYCITLPWEMYSRFGDRRILEQMFPTIERWLAFLETKSANDLLKRWGGEWDFLGDWLWPGADGVNGDTRETLFFNNCYWVYNLDKAAMIAQALGKTDAAAKWHARAAQVRTAIHKEFFNPADNSYVNGFQAYLAIALLTDIPPQNLRAAVAERLEKEILVVRKGHIWAGITGGSFVIRQLIDSGRPDLVYAMASKQDYPGWGDMLKRGATTLWEDWEGKLSLSHSSYLHIGAWFIEGLGGIQPGEFGQGYKQFVLKPGLWPNCPLRWVNSSFDSPYGLIRSDWKREQGVTRYNFLVPANTTAKAFLPASETAKITANGKALSRVKGVRELSPEPGYKVLELQPGTYALEAR